MPCAAPIRGYKASNGRLVFFKKTQKEYYQEPYTGLAVPCGTCILCRQEQARQQAVRIVHEAQSHDESSFITLTYSDHFLPDYGSLNYAHLQKFWKRARQHFGKLRYYAVGEYGDKSLRPHYHAIVFGRAFTQDRIIIRDPPQMLWTSPTLERLWGMGQVTIGAVNFNTARYTASYVTKKLRSKQKYVRIDDESGELIALEQPRAFMSRNLAKAWWNQYGRYVEQHDFVIINGQRQKPPKAYDRWLGEVNEQRMEEIKAKRRENIEPESQEKTRARAQNAHARTKSKKKSV